MSSDTNSPQSQNHSIYLPLFLLYVIILIEGFVTISLEILTLRQMIPFVGNSVTVTSLIIGVFLLFLAYGYRQGGKVDEHFIPVLTRNFCIAAVLLGIGLSYPFIDIYFLVYKKLFNATLMGGLLIYLLCITAPLVYLLGQTVPITMHLHKNQDKVGLIGGNVLHVSTIGSFLGSVLTTLILMHYFGVAQTVFVNFCLLFILVIFLNLRELLLTPILLLFFCSFIVIAVNIDFGKAAFIMSNNYGNYSVEDNEEYYNTHGKVLMINRSGSSYLNTEKKAFPYIELIKRILFDDLKLTNKEILVLGAGGFTISAQGAHDNHFTYVDVDPELPDLVKKHFLEKIQGQVVIQDARQFLLVNSKKYDVIIIDTFSNRLSVPTHLLTKEYYELMASRIKPEGYAIFNVVANPLLNDKYAKRMDNTIRSVFGSCMAIPTKYADQNSNIIYVCHKNINDNLIYIDNSNKVDFDHNLN
ncbi:MAG: fused MFS/spermidine synthase [Candidatus Berkiella sp.]